MQRLTTVGLPSMIDNYKQVQWSILSGDEPTAVVLGVEHTLLVVVVPVHFHSLFNDSEALMPDNFQQLLLGKLQFSILVGEGTIVDPYTVGVQ